MMMAAIPRKNADMDTSDLERSELPKIAPAIIAMNGSFAPQGMNVVVMIVILLSRSFSIVLEAMIPGIPHPVPMRIGMKDLPDRPNLLKIRSRTNATLAI